MNNKQITILIAILMIIIIILSSITIVNNKISKDERRFRIDYEKYNGKKNLAKEKYVKIKIPENNKIKYISEKETIKLLKNGTGIIYFGFPQSNWSRNMIETLIDVVKEKDFSLYYLNAYGIRDEKYKSNNDIITVKKGTKGYYKILDLLGDNVEDYKELEGESLKRLYFPTVVFVKKGKIVLMHTSTVDSHTNNQKKLNNKQKKELREIYLEGINKIC